MNVKKAIKKVVAMGVGASMLGATLLGATASPYDLSDYPTPFVQDGMFNGLMVVGDDAAPADIIGVTDIAMSLQYSSTIKEIINVGGEGGVSLGGDSVKFERSGDVLEMNEYLGDVVETMDASDAEALKSFTISNDKGTTDVNQYLRWNWGASIPTDAAYSKTLYSKDDNDETGDFLWFKDGEEAFRYEMEFVEGFESDNTSGSLDDLEDETLHILGEDFAVVDADASTTKLTLKLMGGAIHDTIEEGETKTYTLKGKEYEVTALIISDWAGAVGSAKVKLKINGEVTKEMQEGSTEILNDGTTIGIREVLPNEAGETAGGDILEFYLGAFKIQFEDSVPNNLNSGGSVQVNEETIEDARVDLDFTSTGTVLTINKITYELDVDGVSGDEPYLSPGEGLRENLDEPEGMLADAWDVRYEGLSDPGVSMVEIKSSGDDEYRLSFTNNQGIEYSNVRFLYSNSTNMYYGDDDDALIFSQG
ncbi:S-layer protein, partial [Candidatus Woesearchaeota archaeon]|nr:S-layer protein [Candidatus Woesearchaeota archaeon]